MRLKAKSNYEINVKCGTKQIKVGEEFECVPTSDGIKIDFGNGDLLKPLDNVNEIKKYFDLVD